MKYHDSVAQSTGYLGPALAMMARQEAAMDPISYAIWYEYAARSNLPLKSAVDAHLRNGDAFDETLTNDLYQQYIADGDVRLALQFSEGFQKVMSDMSTSAIHAGDQAGQFGSALEKWCVDWTASNPGKNSQVDAILGLTRNLQGSIAALKGRLDESRHEIEDLQHAVGRAREDAQVDVLTGLTNRRGFDAALADCLSVGTSAAFRPSLIMADIDHFKLVNDTYGHPFGDRVIQAVAQILRKNVKGKDIAARYGGEEFVVLLPDTPPEGARLLAESIRGMVEKVRIKRSSDTWHPANISLSLGVATLQAGELSASLIARTDRALYASKHAGRNRVTVDTA